MGAPELDLSKSELRVYVFLLKHARKNPSSVRFTEIATELAIPKSTLHRIIAKLQKNSLIIEDKDTSGYRILKYVPIGSLKNYIFLRGFLFPKYLIFAALFSFVIATLIVVPVFPEHPETTLIKSIFYLCIFLFFVLSTWFSGLTEKI